MTRSANHWLHYRLHFRRNALTQTNEAQRRRVGTATATLFTQVTVPRRSQAAIERGRDKLQRLAASTCCGRVSAALASPRSRLAAQSNPLHRATKHLGQLRRTVERQRQRAVYAGKVAPERGRRRDEITADVFDNIERFYNPTRRHSAPGSVSPIALEKAHRAQVGVSGFGNRGHCSSAPPRLPAQRGAVPVHPIYIRILLTFNFIRVIYLYGQRLANLYKFCRASAHRRRTVAGQWAGRSSRRGPRRRRAGSGVRRCDRPGCRRGHARLGVRHRRAAGGAGASRVGTQYRSRVGSTQDRQRQAQERAYHFMSAVAGDLPGFEGAARALFANDGSRMRELSAAWPPDVRAYALQLASSDGEVIA